jgi:hypothetical protein
MVNYSPPSLLSSKRLGKEHFNVINAGFGSMFDMKG